MLEERGVVQRLKGMMAEIAVDRRTACGSCDAKSGCGTSVLAGMVGRKAHRIWVENTLDAAPGDRVILGMRDEALVSLSFAAYLIPLFTLLAGGLLGTFVSEAFTLGTEWPAVAAAGAGLGLGLLWLRFGYRHSGNSAHQQIVLLRKEPNLVSVVRPF